MEQRRPVVSRSFLASKRGLDVLLVLLAAPLWVPLLASAALLVWLIDGRPVFFSQTRMGRHCRPFSILKLRTMAADRRPPDGILFEGWTYRGDPRVTRLGRVLRRFRLDELPQLLNVLRGDMSLVGPRPEPWEIAVDLGRQVDDYHTRHLLPPGITGLCQISPVYYQFGTIEESRRKFALDYEYVARASLSQDLRILLRTVRVVCRGAGIS